MTYTCPMCGGADLPKLKPEHIQAGLSLEINGDFIELKKAGNVEGTFTTYASLERILYEADKVMKKEKS